MPDTDDLETLTHANARAANIAACEKAEAEAPKKPPAKADHDEPHKTAVKHEPADHKAPHKK